MSRGKRYSEEKLNIKKVIGTIVVIVLIIAGIVTLVNYNGSNSGKSSKKSISISNSYITVYSNGKWGVINSKGDTVIEPTYDEMIVIPNNTKPIFLIQSDVNMDSKTYSSKAIDEKQNQIFTSYDTVEALQNVDEKGTVYYDTNALKVSKNGLYGLINFEGKELLAPEYNEITPLKGVKNSFITKKDNLEGLVDDSGNIIIENQYADIQNLTNSYQDGYIVKNDSSKYGLITYDKQQILECKYDEIKNVTGNNLYVVKEGKNLEIIDKDGNVLTKNNFDEVISINGENIIIKKGEKYGAISSDGSEILPCNYDDLKYAFDNNFIAKQNGKYGIISNQSNNVVDFKYESIYYMSDEGFIEANNEDGTSDLIDMQFETRCSGIVSEINTTNNYIKLRVNGEYKFYTFKLSETDEKTIFPAHTLYLSKQNGKYGFVNANGEVIVNYIYDDATMQNQYGYAAVKSNGVWGAIDSDGNVVVKTQYYLLQNTVVSFIGKWHLAPDLNANYYTDVVE